MYATEQGILNEQMNAASAQCNAAFQALENEKLKRKLLIIKSTSAKFGKDGNQYYYIVGDLPEPDCIVGFGDTPMQALDEFCKSYGL